MPKHERYCPPKILSSHLTSIYILCKKKKKGKFQCLKYFSLPREGVFMFGFFTVDITSFLVSKLANSTG